MLGKLDVLIANVSPQVDVNFLADDRDALNYRVEANDGDHEPKLGDFKREGIIGGGFSGNSNKAKHEDGKMCALKMHPES